MDNFRSGRATDSPLCKVAQVSASLIVALQQASANTAPLRRFANLLRPLRLIQSNRKVTQSGDAKLRKEIRLHFQTHQYVGQPGFTPSLTVGLLPRASLRN